MAFDYEVTVIGGGPGGYVAAIKAAQQGKKTCIVEHRYFGGTCLNVGCIPTKTLIKSANLLSEAAQAETFGIEGIDKTKLSINMEKLQARKNAVVKQLVSGVKGLLAGNGVKMVEGSARFIDANTILVNDKKITSAYFIIATGSETAIPSFIEQQGTNHLVTSKELLSLQCLPKSIAIIGGGVIGIEFAYLLNKLGVTVSVIELMDHILPMVDREISNLAKARLAKDGVKFFLGASVKTVRDDCVVFERGGKADEVKADMVLMAVGRVANTDGLNAKGIGIALEKTNIQTSETMQTNIPNIYAVGDVNGKVMLAHTASCEAEIAVDHICGKHKKMQYDQIPSCIYLEPEIACIGLTEEQARKQYGDHIKVGRFPLFANGKSLIEGDTDGMFKVVLHETYGEILGAHFYGKHATEMIGEVAAAMKAEATAEEVIETIHPHPTVNESVKETFLAAWCGKAIHNL